MLSKVLRGSDRVAIAEFPDFSAEHCPATQPRDTALGQASAGELAHLREQLQRSEAQRSSERREAHENGFREGEEKARTELAPVIERLNASIADVTSLRAEMRRRAERDTVQLAMLIARKVLHRELAVDDNALTAIARVAFERLTRSESYTITVHPRFAAAITAALPASHAPRVHIQQDPACEPGTLHIHSVEGAIDASIDTQLEEITSGLTDRLRHAT